MSRVHRSWLLLPLGTVTVLATVVWSFVLPLTPVRMARSSADLIPASGLWSELASLPWPVPVDGSLIAVSLVLTGMLAIVAYAAAVAVVWDRPATGRLLAGVLVPAGLALGVSTVALPTQSGDIVDYLLSGRVAVVHGADPYVVPPDAFPDDPLLPYASGQYTTDPEAKPPIWLAGAMAAAAITSGSSPANAVLITRVLFLGLTLVNTGLIAAILWRRRPQHLLAGIVLYTWSPIVLMHGQAKFDTLMASFALIAGLALVGARPLASIAALWAAIMVKLLAAPLIAVSMLGDLVARRWGRALASGALMGVMTILLYLPFGAGISEAVSHLTDAAGSGSSLPAAVTVVVMVVAAALLLWSGVRGKGEVEGTIQGWSVAALTVVPLSLTGSAWYLIMPIAVVSLSGDRWRSGVLIALSAVAFLLDSWGRNSNPAYPLPEPFGLSRAEALLVGGAVVALLGPIVLAGCRLANRRAARSTASAGAAEAVTETGSS